MLMLARQEVSDAINHADKLEEALEYLGELDEEVLRDFNPHYMAITAIREVLYRHLLRLDRVALEKWGLHNAGLCGGEGREIENQPLPYSR